MQSRNETAIAVLLSGRGSNFKAIYEAIESGRIKNTRIACVISNKENAGGLAFAKEKGIDAIFLNPKSHIDKESYDMEVLRLVISKGANLICLAGYMKIVTPALIDSYYGRIMNIHPSLLPAFPGMDAQKQALDYGVKISGCTVHFVDHGMDTGPVILQSAVPVFEDDTEETLSARILTEEHKLYPKAVALFADGKLKLENRNVKISE